MKKRAAIVAMIAILILAMTTPLNCYAKSSYETIDTGSAGYLTASLRVATDGSTNTLELFITKNDKTDQGVYELRCNVSKNDENIFAEAIVDELASEDKYITIPIVENYKNDDVAPDVYRISDFSAEAIQLSITVKSANEKLGIVSIQGTSKSGINTDRSNAVTILVEPDTTLKLVAEATDENKFVGWQLDDKVVSDQSTYSVKVTKSATFLALFEKSEVHEHDYGSVIYEWNENHTSCMATFVCRAGDSNEVVECEISRTTVREATYEDFGREKLIAVCEFQDVSYKSSPVEISVPKLEPEPVIDDPVPSDGPQTIAPGDAAGSNHKLAKALFIAVAIIMLIVIILVVIRIINKEKRRKAREKRLKEIAMHRQMSDVPHRRRK